MKLFATLIRNTLAFLCLGILLAASNTVGQQKTLKELIVGTWLLDSVYDQCTTSTRMAKMVATLVGGLYNLFCVRRLVIPWKPEPSGFKALGSPPSGA